MLADQYNGHYFGFQGTDHRKDFYAMSYENGVNLVDGDDIPKCFSAMWRFLTLMSKNIAIRNNIRR